MEAKFGNQIGARFPSRRFPLWLAQVEANLAAGHVAEPNDATTEASSVACSNVELTPRLVARRGFHPRKVDGVPGNTRQSYPTLRNDEQKWHNSKVKYTLDNSKFLTAQTYAPLAERSLSPTRVK